MLTRQRIVSGFVFFLAVLSGLACVESPRKELFELVWGHIEESYPDPSFGGVDWHSVGERYRARVLEARTDEELFDLLNAMLFELGNSHIGIGRLKDASNVMSPYLVLDGSPGLDLRLIGGEAVVVSVKEDSPAERAGLFPGDVIEQIDDVALENFQFSSLEAPPSNPRNRRHLRTQQLLRRIFGEAGTRVRLQFRNAADERRIVSLPRVSRAGGQALVPGMPEVLFFLEVETRYLDRGIGYLRFNAFQPTQPHEILNAIASFHEAPGLIIDLRGNDGGSSAAMGAIASALLERDASVCRVVRRHSDTTLTFFGNAEAYTGSLAILVDGSSVSAAELFPSCLPPGRALIVGEQTPGAVTAGELELLPDAIAFVHPVAHYFTSDGVLLEGRGVLPDIPVSLTRAALSAGVDSQLEAALQALKRSAAKKAASHH